MGTRADFYVGRGEQAEWLGSIGWDGHPGGIDLRVLNATSEEAYREAVATLLAETDDSTLPENGWPWPWNTSRTTDYAYAFDGGSVYGSCYGEEWFRVDPTAENYGEPEESSGPKTAVFPDMSARKNVRLDGGSGLMVFGAKK